MLAILAPILVFGLVIFVHELGHFIAAKAMGVYAPRFSIGFGPALFRKRWGETEYILAVLPLGGYVRMASRLDEDAALLEGGSETAPRPESPDFDPKAMIPFGPLPIPEHRLFESKPLPARLLILIAGVTMNVLLALVIGVALAFHFGRTVVPTRVLGQIRPLPNAPELARLHPGDTLVSVNGRAVTTWNDVAREISTSTDSITFRTTQTVARVGLDHGTGPSVEDVLASVDFQRPAVLDTVLPDGRARAAGLQDGDSVVAIDGRAIATWSDLVGVVNQSPERKLRFTVVRQGRTLDVDVTPKATQDSIAGTREVRTVGKIGAGPRTPTRKESLSFGAA